MSEPSDWGKYYWRVEFAKSPPEYIDADRVEIVDGALLFWGHQPSGKDILGGTVLAAFAPGTWTHLYAASVLDGSAVALDKGWPEEQ